MALTLPSLPYAYDALQPYMSKETLEFHHDKHHQAYVTNGNKLMKDKGLEVVELEELVKTFKAIVRIDTPEEIEYYRHGGILQYVLRQLVGK